MSQMVRSACREGPGSGQEPCLRQTSVGSSLASLFQLLLYDSHGVFLS